MQGIELKLEAEATPEFTELVSLDEHPAFAKQRFVLVSVKTNKAATVNFTVKVPIIRQIPLWSQAIDSFAIKFPDTKRLRVTEKKLHREEVFVQALEYLEWGSLEPIDTSNTKAWLHALTELIALYDFSTTMSIPELESAIVESHQKRGLVRRRGLPQLRDRLLWPRPQDSAGQHA